MVAFKSQYARDMYLNWLRGVTAPAALTTLWAALVTTAPTAIDGTGLVEATGGSYQRQPISNAQLTAPSTNGSGTSATRQISNNAQLSFSNMPAATLVGGATFDSLPQANPAAPTLGGVTGGSTFTAGQQVWIAYTWLTPGGETALGTATSQTIATNSDSISVTVPALPTGATGWNVYVASATSGTQPTLYKYNGAALTGTSTTVTGFAPNTNAAGPGANTSGGHFLGYADMNGGSQAVAGGATFNVPVSQFVASE